MKYKFLTGSKYLGLSTNSDTDYVVIYVDENYTRRSDFDNINKIDIHNWYLKDIIKLLNFEISLDAKSSLRYLHNVFLSRFINQIPNYTYNIFYHRSEYKEFLLKCKEHNYINLNYEYALNINNGYLSKFIYKVIYLLFIFQNNSYEMTKEQLEIIQKIHDTQMPCEYLKTIYKMIDEL